MSRWVLSDGVQVTWIGGHLSISNRTTPDLSVTTDDPSVLPLLHAFRGPADPETVVAALEKRSAAAARTLMHRLAAVGALVPDVRVRVDSPGAGPGVEEIERVFLERRQKLTFLKYDDLGLTVTNCGKAELSPGCQACKSGSWVCVFVGLRCNATCPFCPQPAAARSIDESSFGGGWVGRLLAGLEAHGSKVGAVSIGGGEPLLYDGVLGTIARWVKAHLPHVYQWVDTNGLLASADQLKRLRDYGIDEVRFNLAASEFRPAVMARIRDHAVRIVPWISVEVPTYEVTYHHLFEREKVVELDEMGVRQLNLGQLYPGAATSPASITFAQLFGDSPGGKVMTAAVARYRHWTYDILELAYRKNLKIRINDCSDDAKTAQRLSRERLGGSAMMALADLTYPRPDPPPEDLRTPPADGERTPSGAVCRTLKPGSGTRRPANSDCVELRYIGWTADGVVVDSSYRTGMEGVVVRLDGLRAEMSETIRSMTSGEKRRVWIQQPSGSGQAAGPPRWLVVDVDLLAIRPAEAP